MRPRKDGEAVVDVLDVILRDGVMIQADIVIGIADIPLIGINLRAALGGMTTMTEYGFFEEWDREIRRRPRESQPILPATAPPAFEEPGETEQSSATDSDV